MQLAKTVAALGRLADAGVPYISVLTDPTTGGVFASFAALGDINIAEPKSLIGFAGARVAAGTIAEELPDGFQRAEFLLEHGFVDMVVPRAEAARDAARPVALHAPLAAPGQRQRQRQQWREWRHRRQRARLASRRTSVHRQPDQPRAGRHG